MQLAGDSTGIADKMGYYEVITQGTQVTPLPLASSLVKSEIPVPSLSDAAAQFNGTANQEYPGHGRSRCLKIYRQLFRLAKSSPNQTLLSYWSNLGF